MKYPCNTCKKWRAHCVCECPEHDEFVKQLDAKKGKVMKEKREDPLELRLTIILTFACFFSILLVLTVDKLIEMIKPLL